MDRDSHPLITRLRAESSTLTSDLAALVALPTVSRDTCRLPVMRAAAEWLASRLRRAGLPWVRVERAGGPVVIGSTIRLDREPGAVGPAVRCHVLLYAHYDVQPAGGPGWPYAPFRLVRTRDGMLHGRGVADDKGPLLAQLAAVTAILRGGVPLDITVLLDGQEEVGSPNLHALLTRYRQALHPDVALVCDTRMPDPLTPAVVTSFRGSVTLDLALRTPAGSLHAGAFGGSVADPAAGLARLLAGLHDARGLLVVPEAWKGIRMQPPFSKDERRTQLPAVVVTRLSAGTGAVAVPDVARARLNVRAAPGQRTERLAAALVRQLECSGPARLLLAIKSGTPVPPATLPLEGIGMSAARTACLATFGRPPVLTRSGGTIAAVAHLESALGTSVVPLGFVPPGSRVHAAGERWPESMLWRSAETVLWFLLAVAGA